MKASKSEQALQQWQKTPFRTYYARARVAGKLIWTIAQKTEDYEPGNACGSPARDFRVSCNLNAPFGEWF
jgi:hypothetical protein